MNDKKNEIIKMVKDMEESEIKVRRLSLASIEIKSMVDKLLNNMPTNEEELQTHFDIVNETWDNVFNILFNGNN